MSQNIEVKAFVPNPDLLKGRILKLPITSSQIIIQHDTFFFVPFGRLKVRRFPDRQTEIIFYLRRNAPGPTSSFYFRFPIPRYLRRALSPVAHIWPRMGDVVKVREVFFLNETRIHLDMVKGLGSFLELEVVLQNYRNIKRGFKAATKLINRLGIQHKDLIPDAYIDLLNNKRTRS